MILQHGPSRRQPQRRPLDLTGLPALEPSLVALVDHYLVLLHQRAEPLTLVV